MLEWLELDSHFNSNNLIIKKIPNSKLNLVPNSIPINAIKINVIIEIHNISVGIEFQPFQHTDYCTILIIIIIIILQLMQFNMGR